MEETAGMSVHILTSEGEKSGSAKKKKKWLISRIIQYGPDNANIDAPGTGGSCIVPLTETRLHPCVGTEITLNRLDIKVH